jgi:hypothetical protein
LYVDLPVALWPAPAISGGDRQLGRSSTGFLDQSVAVVLTGTISLDPGNSYDKVNIAADGTVYSGDRKLQADGAWKQLKYSVQSISADGKLLVNNGGRWGILDPKGFDDAADLALRLGMTYSIQPLTHFAGLNLLPQEQGAVRHGWCSRAELDMPLHHSTLGC